MTDIDKILYWKNRIDEKLKATERDAKRDFQEVAQWSDHIELDHKNIQKNMSVVILAIQELRRSILKAKTK